MSQELIKGNCRYVLDQDRLEVYIKCDDDWQLRDTVTGPTAHKLFKLLSIPEPPASCGI